MAASGTVGRHKSITKTSAAPVSALQGVKVMRVLLAALAATAGARPPAPLKYRGGSVAPQKPPPPPKTLKPPNEDTTTPLERQLLEKVRVYARGLDAYVKPEKVVKKALAGAAALDYATVEQTLAENAAYAATEHPDYGRLAARLAVDRLHATTSSSFKETLLTLDDEPNPTTGEPCHILDAGFRAALENDKYFVAQVEGAISDERDFDGFDYFGYKTLEKSYLLRHRGGAHGNGIAERPQHLLMRVALGIHRGTCYSVHAREIDSRDADRRLGELRAVGTGPGDLRPDEPGPLHPRVADVVPRRPEAGPFVVVFFARIDG